MIVIFWYLLGMNPSWTRNFQGIDSNKYYKLFKIWELYKSWHYNGEYKKNYFIDDNADNYSASPTLLAAKEYKNQQLQQLSTNNIPRTNAVRGKENNT